MKLFAFSIAVSALVSVAVCGAAQAAPISPVLLASDATAANITPVYFHHWHHHVWRHRYPPAGYWDYYRTDWPGRGNNEESTR
jgi:hypothetical protein